MYRVILIVSIVFVSVTFPAVVRLPCHAMSVDTFRLIPRKQLIPAAGHYYNEVLYQLDFAAAFSALDQLAVIAEERRAPELETYTLLLKGRYCYDRNRKKDRQPLRYFDSVLAAKVCPEAVATEALFFKGAYYYYPLGIYPEAFEYMLKANEDAQRIGYRNLPAAGFLLCRLALGHLHFNEPETALHYLRQAARLPGNSPINTMNLYNTMGMAYVEIQQYDSAIYNYGIALEYAKVWHEAWVGIISGNIGNVYYQMGWYDTAAKLLHKDFDISSRKKNYSSAGSAAIILAKIYLARKDFAHAAQMLGECQTLLSHLKKGKWRAEYYECLSLLHKERAEYRDALRYSDSFIQYTKNYSTEWQKEILDQARSKNETDRHLANIRLLESEKSKEILARNAMLIVFALLLVVIVQAYRKVHFRRRKDREIFLMERRRKEEELATARRELGSYVDRLKQQQQLVDQFSREIEQLHEMVGSSSSVTAEKEEALTRLQTTTILTEDDWIGFKELFTRVHPDFFIKLNEKLPTLTQAEIRLLALTKLGLSVREKANLLGVSPQAVRKTRLRLEKKTGLQIHEIIWEEYSRGGAGDEGDDI
jgi:DNA-binding CsgD family transcriptional regulator